ncbi:hypothetical protein MNEG_16303, partial [Monoraphidium neglectum]
TQRRSPQTPRRLSSSRPSKQPPRVQPRPAAPWVTRWRGPRYRGAPAAGGARGRAAWAAAA